MKGMFKVIICLLCMVMAMSGMVFAAESSSEEKSAVPISAELPEYVVKEGEITSVSTDTGYVRLTVGGNEDGIVLILKEDIAVIDYETQKELQQSELKEGMYVYALIAGKAPTTLSLPPQTSGALVIIAAEKDTDIDFETYYAKFAPETDEDTADVYTELREGAEAKGYKVTWTSHKAPITITKDDITAEVTIGSDEFTYTHMTRDLQPLDKMEKLAMPTKLENGKTMVPQSFIDALK